MLSGLLHFLNIYITSIISITKNNCNIACIISCFFIIILFLYKLIKYAMLNTEVIIKTIYDKKINTGTIINPKP